jgi:hypothetical protein
VIDDLATRVGVPSARRAAGLRAGWSRFAVLVRSGLFPDAEPGVQPWPLVLAGYLLAAAAGFVVDVWWAGPSLHTLSRIWAEDGETFLSGAYQQHFTHTFLLPYAGYMHAVPRALAELTTLLPVHDAARFLTCSSALIRVGTALFVFRASGGHLRSVVARFMLGASVVLLPVGGLETLDNIANLHWFLTFAAFWALLWRPARWSDRVIAAVVVVAAVGSDPAAGLWLPLALLRAATLRRWRDHVVTIAYLGAGVVQGLVVLSTSRGTHHTLGAGSVARFYGARVLVGTLGGFQHTQWLMTHWHGIAVALGALVLAALVLPAVAAAGASRWLAVSAIAAAAADFGLALRDLRVAPHVHVDLVTSVPRYDVIPTLLMLSAVAAGLDQIVLRRSGRRLVAVAPRRTVALVITARIMVAAAFLSALPPDMAAARHFWTRSVGTVPGWHLGVASRAPSCYDGSASTIRVPVLPEGWSVAIPCSAVRRWK